MDARIHARMVRKMMRVCIFLLLLTKRSVRTAQGVRTLKHNLFDWPWAYHGPKWPWPWVKTLESVIFQGRQSIKNLLESQVKDFWGHRVTAEVFQTVQRTMDCVDCDLEQV